MISGVSTAISSFVRPQGPAAPRPGEAGAVAHASADASARDAAAAKDGSDLPAAKRVQPASESEKSSKPGAEQLSEEEQKQVQELKQRDREVRAHEEAHARTGGNYASPPSYKYETGPDGKRYAVEGEVKIDAAPVRDNPEATVRKMDVVIRAALAPADPSPEDLQVARKAQMERAKAQIELQKQREAEQKGETEDDAQDSSPLSALLRASQAYGAGQARAAEQAAAALFGAETACSLIA